MEYRTEEIKQHLREGALVIAKRQTGKTTAILQFAKELLDAGENVAIQVVDTERARNMDYLWAKLYGQHPSLQTEPFLQITPDVTKLGRGMGECKILVDDLFQVRDPHCYFAAATSAFYKQKIVVLD